MSEACSFLVCAGLGEYRVVIITRAPAPHDDAPPAPIYLDLAVCGPCRRTLHVADVVTDESWANILAGFDQLDRIRPDRARTTLDFIPIGGAEDELARVLLGRGPRWA